MNSCQTKVVKTPHSNGQGKTLLHLLTGETDRNLGKDPIRGDPIPGLIGAKLEAWQNSVKSLYLSNKVFNKTSLWFKHWEQLSSWGQSYATFHCACACIAIQKKKEEIFLQVFWYKPWQLRQFYIPKIMFIWSISIWYP